MNQVEACLKTWAEAMQKADETSRMLIDSNHSAAVTQECTARMKTLSAARAGLEQFRGRTDTPPELKRFFTGEEAASRACEKCWLLYGTARTHPTCVELIDEFTSSQEALLKYSLMI